MDHQEATIDHYDACVTADKCLLSAPLHIFQSYMEQAVCSSLDIETVRKGPSYCPWAILRASLSVLPIILPTLLGLTLSQLLCQHLSQRSLRRFLLEFLLITLPTVCSNTVANSYNNHYCIVVATLITLLLLRCGAWRGAAAKHCYEVGKKPAAITLLRATSYICTGCAILAVDFKAFPIEWRKSREYGASLMDVGIGMFVMSMGVVSQRAHNWADMRRVLKVVLPLLMLGLARTVVITLISYHQDEHEYGTHLNAFFTLGLTKLLASLCSLLARSDKQLLPLSLAILMLHELFLQQGLAAYVMSSANRSSFLSANREGLSALPGCISLYLLSVWGGRWYKAMDKLSYEQFLTKLRKILLVTAVTWLLAFACVFLFGIARVTFNAGYVFWLFGIGTLLLLLCSFLFELCLMAPTEKLTPLPALVETINMNGLTYFMLCNFLTGLVNLTLNPAKRSSGECVAILMLYMLASTGMVYVLFRKGIRIA
ncbi:uncharacterized protein At4g17910 [Drosophila mojavensis]|uniref:Phosphatidylinositol-glycan biosynthesis class W protein n=1 Tax=Drosophila mojavensis TaxID=7230 RepID=B4KGV3_DROMO|nr:uncharacterized protein At4g17910 [Drosophila mojavensis]EDW11153.1 uncharacterized protein Dmoj_GI15507 [Drosophila mojavensis]